MLHASTDPHAGWKRALVFFSWLHMLWICTGFLLQGPATPGMNAATIFHVTAWLCYSALYLTPLIMIMMLSGRLPRRVQLALALAVSSSLLLLVRIDAMIQSMYSFHINHFVLNLIFTPGGISSLGTEGSSYLSVFLIIGSIVSIQAFALWLCLQRLPGQPWTQARGLALGGWLFCFAAQGLLYGSSDVLRHAPVLEASRAWPLFQRIRFRSLAARLGIEREHDSALQVDLADAALHYPLAPVTFTTPARAPNIILLVAESLRWDQLDPMLMPNTSRFGEQHLRFDNHYSSGNGTREGLFGMFYGLYGSYWEQFMLAGRSPLLMDRLQQLGYEFDLRTGARFTYPEFDKTLFAGIDRQLLHEADDDLPPWQRDERNMDALLAFLTAQDRSVPFMAFQFFESTHASYYFPEDSALFRDYQQNVDYTRMSGDELQQGIDGLFNRYRNAAHWVDVQLGRLYSKLEADGLLDDTIVIVTGDHGEEFLEQGRWGHNSAFNEQQTHVPMVAHIPGMSPAVINATTSHLDIATTLLQALGAPEDASGYSLGLNLSATRDRDYIVVSDWRSIGVQTPRMKYRIPYLNSGTDFWLPTDGQDHELQEASATTLLTQYRDSLLEAMLNCRLFMYQG
jgi:membrane-anchored protein YejM (alkaline phosphatase superfamily)